MNTEKAIAWAEKIPMEELFDEIRRLTGLSELKFNWKVEEVRNYVVIKYSSNDIVDHVGFLKLMFSEMCISEFNSQVMEDEETGEFKYWGTTSFRYSHPSGGSNGCTFLNVWYDDRRGWTFDQR